MKVKVMNLIFNKIKTNSCIALIIIINKFLIIKEITFTILGLITI